MFSAVGAALLTGYSMHDETPETPDEERASFSVADLNVTRFGVATRTDDEMSFGEAFAAARAEVGPGGAFSWRGKVYGTFYKDEWNSLPTETQKTFGENAYTTAASAANTENDRNTDETEYTDAIRAEAGAADAASAADNDTQSVKTAGTTEGTENTEDILNAEDAEDTDINNAENILNTEDILNAEDTEHTENVGETDDAEGTDIMGEVEATLFEMPQLIAEPEIPTLDVPDAPPLPEEPCVVTPAQPFDAPIPAAEPVTVEVANATLSGGCC
jgi:hypothetical protein